VREFLRFYVKKDFLSEYQNIALMEGKEFIMPIRFLPDKKDYVVLPMDYFLRLYEKN
jgi:hypothetical protein